MLRRFITPLAIAGVLLVTIEFAVRFFFPEIGPLDTDRRLIADGRFGATAGIAPNVAARSYGALFTSDAHGFWQYATPSDTTRPAYLLIGDSVTMGIGVDADSTFAGFVAAALDSVTVLNASLIGYSVADYHRVLTALLSPDAHHPYRIAHATVFWCLNDIYADLPAGDPNETLRRSMGRMLRWIRRYVYTYQWLKNALADRAEDYYHHDRAFYEKGGLYVDRSVQLLREMSDMASRRQVSFDVVLLPYRHQLTTRDHEVFVPQRLFASELKKHGIAVTDVSDLGDSSGHPERLYRFGDGIHLSAAGHRRVAERLLSGSMVSKSR